MASNEDIPTIYKRVKCWSIIPSQHCPNNCPGDFSGDSEDEAFGEDMTGFLELIKGKKVNVVQAPEPEILELIPN